MRKHIAFLVIALAAILFVGVVSQAGGAPDGQHPKSTVNRCPEVYTAGEFRAFASQVWDLERWGRDEVKDASITKMQRMRQCAAGPGHRVAMRKMWREDKAKFLRHRRVEYEWLGCPSYIKHASTSYHVRGAVLYGIEGAESTWGAGGSNLFGLIMWGGPVSEPEPAAMESARLMRQLHDESGSWEAAMLHYSGGGYGLSHPLELNGGTCP